MAVFLSSNGQNQLQFIKDNEIDQSHIENFKFSRMES